MVIEILTGWYPLGYRIKVINDKREEYTLVITREYQPILAEKVKQMIDELEEFINDELVVGKD